jgi:pimeloyl-ACP methyl ester carboxylesterase
MTIEYATPASQWVDIDGPVHFVDHGGPAGGPLLVCVHGLGGSLLNWGALAPRLTGTARVVAVDLAGFGRTRALGRSATIAANRRLLHRFLTEVTGTPVILVGNSMGGLISTLEAAAHPEVVAGTILIDPALPPVLAARPDPLVAWMFALYAVPPLGRAALRARRREGAERAAMQVLKLCTVDVGRVPAEVVKQHLALARVRGGFDDADHALVAAARSLMWVLAARRRHYARLRSIRGPVLLLHGDRDRLVNVDAARAVARANPSWRFEVAEGVGHVPQLEVPDWTAGHILDWLGNEGRHAADQTRRQETR